MFRPGSNKRKYIITIKGKTYTWIIIKYISERAVFQMREDGLQVDEVEIEIPSWIVYAGLARVYTSIFSFFDRMKY